MKQIMDSLKNPAVLARLEREFRESMNEDSDLEAKRVIKVLQQHSLTLRPPHRVNPTKVNTTVRRAVHRVCVPRMGR